MVFTGMPYSSWKRQSRSIEELKHIFLEKESMKRERENEFIQECIERDLEFAKEHYQTTGNITYSIPVNDLPKDFNTLEIIIEVNLYDLVHYIYSDDLRFFYKTSQISFLQLWRVFLISLKILLYKSILCCQTKSIFLNHFTKIGLDYMNYLSITNYSNPNMMLTTHFIRWLAIPFWEKLKN